MPEKMKAAVLHAVGDLRYEDVPVPELNPGETLIKVKAAGVCGSDVPRVKKKGTYSFPLIPGHEFAGEISEINSDISTDFKAGDKVAVFPLIPCRKCPYCQIGEYAQCDNYDYLGSRTDGGFAEYITAPIANLVKVPDNVSFEWAAMTEPASVALHALRRSGVDAGDNVVILGAGPIGIILAQWARICGAGRVFVTDIVDEKLSVAKDYGFKNCINSRRNDPVETVIKETGGIGADLCIEAAGTPVTFEQSLRIVRKLGKVVLMGNVSGNVTIPEKTASAILRGQLTIYGTWNSSFTAVPKNEWKTALQFMSSKALDLENLITHRFNLKQAVEVFDMMYKKQEFFNKVMFVF
ncbi:alcohol dehydrogenase catalytic domain-containing protein [Candidatus Poribacteria bacterium]|nr:alcohol dehydrogenase catalytic domain-containing protein [Candidatus Poribacteria bacterium]